MITVLTGGTGGAKFVDGLRRVVPPEELTVIVNTGDDHKWWGLHVSPDIDSITYMLADLLSPERGWGVRGETFHCLQAMKALGGPAWFSVGDRDLAMHLLRTELLSNGRTLNEATREITALLGIKSRVLPMSDQRVQTRVETPAGEFSFQEYFVQRCFQDAVNSVTFEGAAQARPASGVLEAIAQADRILIAPSNPITSIGPILVVPGIRDALIQTPALVIAVSPIVGNAAVTGPAGALMSAQGLPVSAAGVAKAYSDFVDVLVIDESDATIGPEINTDVVTTNILMRSTEDRIRVARTALEAAQKPASFAEAS